MTTKEVLERIASGDNIYSFVCANGNDTIKAAQKALEAINRQEKLDELLKRWELKNE